MSELAQLSAKLEDTQERVKSAQQLVEVDLQLTAESLKGMSRKSHFLRTEHARMVELERQLASARHESQDRAAEATVARAEGQRAAERATAAEQGLEAAKARQAETEAGLRTSLANTEAAL